MVRAMISSTSSSPSRQSLVRQLHWWSLMSPQNSLRKIIPRQDCSLCVPATFFDSLAGNAINSLACLFNKLGNWFSLSKAQEKQLFYVSMEKAVLCHRLFFYVSVFSPSVWKLYCSLRVGPWWNDRWFIGSPKLLRLWTFLSSCSAGCQLFPATKVTIQGEILTTTYNCKP